LKRAARVGALLAAAAVPAGVVAGARPARADPQASLGMTVGGAIERAVGPWAATGAFHMGARADVLLFRSRPGQMALGPYADLATAGFDDVDVGGGAEWLLPITDDMPLVVGAGALARNGEGRSWAPGGEATLFFGSRSYNFESWYGLAAGAFAQARWVPTAPATLDVVVGVQIDAQLLALPILFAYEAVAH
jgi:hypothetical protein